MLKKIEAYTSRQGVDTLELIDTPLPWRDFLHIVSVDGLDPVTASISTTGLPSADLSLISGEEIPARNIVLTLAPDPDWSTWTPEELRRLVYSYFMPKYKVRLVFYTDTRDPVEIYGEVEACSYNQFAPDPQYQISIICPDPYFVSVAESIVTGLVTSLMSGTFGYLNGTDVPIGCVLKIVEGYESGELVIQSGDPSISSFRLIVDYASRNPMPNIFEMDSRPLKKKVRVYNSDTGTVTNLLRKLQPGFEGVWPVLEPGNFGFAVMGDTTGIPWQLTWFEKYGGL